MLLVRSHSTSLEIDEMIQRSATGPGERRSNPPPNAVIMEILKSLAFLTSPGNPPGPAIVSRLASMSKISSGMVRMVPY